MLLANTRTTKDAAELLFLSNLRRKAGDTTLADKGLKKLKVAIIGGFTFHPLDLFLAQKLWGNDIETELFVGNYDNYIPEIMDKGSALYKFAPQVVILVPSPRRYSYPGHLLDPMERHKAAADGIVEEIHGLCRELRSGCDAQIILTNFRLPPDNGLGPLRSRYLGADWNFLKYINMQLGLTAPEDITICDLEFLSCYRGLGGSTDDRGWYQSRQMTSIDLLCDLACELSHLIINQKSASKKVIVLDLDNTLWGGVIGDDGVNGIELGDTSARGEAFKDFQKFLKSLKDYGFLLAVSSKNEEENARIPFESHPDSALRMKDFVSFKANWRPKADNIKEIAEELNLGLDSFVFVDDNPAEIDIVNRFLPEVSTIHLPQDPVEFISLLKRSRLFEIRGLTAEDRDKTAQYQVEDQRSSLKKTITDMDSYLEALEMIGHVASFQEVDVARITQLINKSNQFNLTTRRRSEADVTTVMKSDKHRCFTVRLQDKFGDYGLIAVIICEIVDGHTLEIESFLMSCRVLERGVEQEVLNKIVRLAQEHGINTVRGIYIPSKKNGLVKELYTKLGFRTIDQGHETTVYELDVDSYIKRETKIKIVE